MPTLLHELAIETAERTPDACALRHLELSYSYQQVARSAQHFAAGLTRAGLRAHERVAIYLPKRFETVSAIFGTSLAGGAFVPVHPNLKVEQVRHILRDCDARVLITTAERATYLSHMLAACPALRTLVLVDSAADSVAPIPGVCTVTWDALIANTDAPGARAIDHDLAAILYTSGSTGRPKGVALSHRNLLAGAQSVSSYLHNTSSDRLLAVLPFSFDYGLNQLTTAFLTGASVVLLDYLLPRDVMTAIARERITGLAAVPTLWIQLAQLDWPAEAAALRYITNSGGAMPRATLNALRTKLPRTRIFLMYGLTEAFRSTCLDPDELDRRPDSIGQAIPNADVRVVRPDGTECAPDEPGELVHRGALVALGYWNDAAATAQRFRALPLATSDMLPVPTAVWSGDLVRRDAEGFLYFLGRNDDLIKTAGYRVSPTEIEEVLYATGHIEQAAAMGIPHPVLGQAIIAVVTAPPGHTSVDLAALFEACKTQLPAYMVPAQIHVRSALPHTPNGKIDRRRLATEYADHSSATP